MMIVDLEGDLMMTVVLGVAWTSPEAPGAVLMTTGVRGEVVVVMMREEAGGVVMTQGLGSLWADQVMMVLCRNIELVCVVTISAVFA